MKRIFCLLLALIMMACALVSCVDSTNGDGDAVATTTPAPSEPNPDNGENNSSLSLIADGEAKVRVVYNKKDDPITVDAAKSLADSLTELSGVKVYPVVDFAAKKDSSCINILFGKTSYSASDTAIGELAPNSFSVTVSDNTIIVASNNVYLYSDATDALLSAVSVSGNNMSLDKSFSKVSDSYPVLSLAADDQTEYTIIYENANTKAKDQAKVLQGAFSDKKIDIDIYPDTRSASGKEILIGATNREASKNSEAYYLNAHSRPDGNGNLAITGNLAAGVADLCKYIYQSDDNIVLPEFLFGIVAPAGYGNAPKYEGSGTVKLVENHELSSSYYIQAANANQSDYKDYIKKLEAAGFEKYYSTDAKKSLFSIYTDGYNIVNLSYIEYVDSSAKYINIAIDCIENSALPPLKDKSEQVTDIQVTIVNTECSFIIRLEDGRFIVYDGGTNGIHNRDNAKLLYDQLVAQNVLDGKPTIAAWFVSHHHGDHVGGFINFLSKYKDKITLESIVMNTPSQATMSKITDGKDYEYGWITNVFNKTAQFVPNAKIIMAHAGQSFAYAGLTVDVLYTPENYYGGDMFYGNHEVCIYSFDTENGRMIFTGDAQPENCKMVSKIYDNTLKADFVQYAHHGYRGGEVNFYKLIGARYGLWTQDIESLKAKGKRPQANYNGVDPNSSTVSLVPTNTEEVIIFTADMTKADLQKYIYKTW